VSSHAGCGWGLVAAVLFNDVVLMGWGYRKRQGACAFAQSACAGVAGLFPACMRQRVCTSSVASSCCLQYGAWIAAC
jgi:hypothetical protein